MPKRTKAEKERDARYDDKRRGQRNLNWTFIVYPDSAPDDWRDLINDYSSCWVESPLHDKDLNPEPNSVEPKKPHWHIIACFESLKTFEQVRELTALLNAPIPQQVKSTSGSVRYMIHMDNPEKYQYDKSLIVPHGTFDLSRAFPVDRYAAIGEMVDFIEDNNITEFCQLLKYARQFNSDWFKLLCDSSAYVVGLHIKSFRHHSKQLHNPENT